MDKDNDSGKSKRIVVIKNGPYIVEGEVPLLTKTQVVSEHGEPLTWQKEGTIPVNEAEYHLCRCGQTSKWPFCDGTHRKVGFDGTETADAGLFETRAMKLPFGSHIIVKKDISLCMDSGFCGFSDAGLNQLLAASSDTKMRSLIMAMVERCPSGALTYSIQKDGSDIEPDLPQQVALTIEITSEGPIAGPVWVSGGIPVERADGQACETRNRVTLCNCGRSCNKPFCDGFHRNSELREARRQRVTGQ